MSKKQGAIIAFEAIDGAGLTTHSKKLTKALYEYYNLPAFRDKEPTYEVIGDLIWHAIRGFYPSLRASPILALLFAADRLHHLYRKIPGRPYGQGGIIHRVADGAIAILDRYKYTSYAYQAVDPQMPLPLDWIKKVNAYAPPPHILIYLDVPLDVALQRLVKDRSEVQLFEKKEELKRVKEEFDKIVNDLQRRPEYCPGNDAPWKEALLRENLDPEALYPSGLCYPVIIKAREVVNGKELSADELEGYIEAAVLIVLERLGAPVFIDKKIRENYSKAINNGIIEVSKEL